MDTRLIIQRTAGGLVVVQCDTDGFDVILPDPTGPPELVDQQQLWDRLGDMVDHADEHNGHGKYA